MSSDGGKQILSDVFMLRRSLIFESTGYLIAMGKVAGYACAAVASSLTFWSIINPTLLVTDAI